MKDKIQIILLVVIIILLTIVVFTKNSNNNSAKSNDYEFTKKIAVILSEKGLYNQSVEEYKKLLKQNIDSEEKEKIWYVVGNLYFDKLKDYEKALNYFYKIRTHNPESKYIKFIGSKIVQALENTGKSVEAQNTLEALSNVNKTKNVSADDKLLAVVGKDNIFQSDLNEKINEMPDAYKKQFYSKEGKKKLLQQMVQNKIFYNIALRKGYDKDDEVNKQVLNYKEAMLQSKVYQEEILSKIHITTDMMKLYYHENKDKFIHKTDNDTGPVVPEPFEKVKEQIKNILAKQQEQQLLNQFTQQITKNQNVQIFFDNIN